MAEEEGGIILLHLPSKGLLNLFPNPTIDNLVVQIKKISRGYIEYQIVNILGDRIFKK